LVLLLLLELLLSFVPVVGHVLETLPGIPAFLLAVRYTLVGNLFRERSADTEHAAGTGARWRASVSVFVLFLAFPIMPTILATSEGSERTIMAAFRSEFYGTVYEVWVKIVLLVLILALVLAVPQAMHNLARPYRPDSRLPGWLAGLAAVTTAASIISLHFDPSALPTSNLAVLSFAAFGAAVLLAPFYKAMTRACWQLGTEVVFDPVQWWQSWCGAWADITGSSADSTAVEQAAAKTHAAGAGIHSSDPAADTDADA
jgi:hypothetical protein